MTSWLEIDSSSHFSLANIPFGIISTASNSRPRPAVAIGGFALDLDAFSTHGGFAKLSTIDSHQWVFSQTTLNPFAGLGQPVHQEVRKYLQETLTTGGPHKDILENNQILREISLFRLQDVTTHLPMAIGDYTDFYAGENHAYNAGVIFRGPENALQPNYKHLPVGYHGRSSSIVVSGTKIKRPSGQILPPGTKEPVFSASKKLDIELEMAAFVCKENKMGSAIPISEAKEYIFGLVLMNDWSARDIQAWEYVPLGPFLGKSFGTTISPWVVLTCALEPFKSEGLAPGNRQSLLPYLRENEPENVYNIDLSVSITTPKGNKTAISKSNSKNLLFSFPQMLAHHSINGCPMRIGDLLGSGTISGKDRESLGSLLEQSMNGKIPMKLEGGEERTFLEDGDEVSIQGICHGPGGNVGFGDCTGKIIA